jgi:hypothetical protein
MDNSPLFVLFGAFLEVFVDGVEFVERYLFLEFVVIEDSYFNGSFSTLIGPVCGATVPLFAYRVELAHFHQHSILLIYLVFLYALVQLLLTIQLSLFVLFQILFGMILDQ